LTINITSAGFSGRHSFKKTNINYEANFVYFKNRNIPSSIQNGVSYIYNSGSGSVSGLSDQDLVYAEKLNTFQLVFKDAEGDRLSFSQGSDSGSFNLNTPVIYEGKLNLGLSTPTNQAVKYYTLDTPMTNLVSGNTYFLKNVDVDFTGTQSLYPFTTHTFTTCGAEGRLGPTSEQLLSGYSTNWHGQYLRQGDFQGYQDWTVPVSGIYSFDVRGASGFQGSANFSRTINQTSLTNNVATIRTATAHNVIVGMSVTISNATNTVYNGTYSVSSIVSPQEFTFARTNANIATATSGGVMSAQTVAGKGARIQGRVSLIKGETITIAVGQTGTAPESGGIYGGSGGGSFIVRKSSSDPLFVAGGGSASTNSDLDTFRRGKDGQTTERGGLGGSSSVLGGSNGFGGPSAGGRSAGGGGFRGRGVDTTITTGGFFNQVTSPAERGGGSFIDGLFAADNGARIGGNGGFGGGGSSDGNNNLQSGGAGGYSGGAGAGVFTAQSTGGGGGSYISPSATNVATSDGKYDDLSTFGGQPITNLNSYNTGNGSAAVTLVESFTSGNTVHPTAADANAGTNAIEVAAGGNSFHAFVPISYDLQNNLIYSTTEHGLNDDQGVTFVFSEPTPDISQSTIYYVDKIDNFSYGLVRNSEPVNLSLPTGRSSSDVLRRVTVNVETDIITIPNHGFQLNQPVQYSSGSGSVIQPLSNGTTYYISEVVDSNNLKLKGALDAPTNINFTAAGTDSEHSFLFLTVNLVENTLYIPGHGLISGQAVVYKNNGGTSVAGLVNDTLYYVIRVDGSTIRLSSSPLLNNTIDLTGVGVGTHSLVIEAINFTQNRLTLPNHGFLQGELVEYNSKGQTEISGLSSNQTYYVIFVDGDNLKLASSPENAVAGIAVDLEASPAGVGRHTLTSLTQTPDGIYEIKSIPSEDTFTVNARGQVPELVITFNPRTTVNVENDTLYLPSHGFLTGTLVSYSVGGSDVEIGGLEDDTDYYAVAINQDFIKLSSSVENANSGITIAFDDFGTGTDHSLRSSQLNGKIVGAGTVSIDSGSILVNGTGTSFSKILKVGDSFSIYPPNTVTTLTFAAADINIETERIVKDHSFVTGDIVRFSPGGGVSPTPLLDEYYYYVGVVDATNIQLYNSKSAAIAGTGFITFSSAGTGTEFSLAKIDPRGPIVRRITAIGSDTQITVDRPYSEEYTNIGYAYPTFVYVRPSGYSIHRPFDGGVEMSTGAGNSFGQIIRQTRKYFRYQSGKGIQTSFAINFKPSIDIQSMERFSPTVIECKTRRPHGLISGLTIKISEAQDSEGVASTVFNGDFQVTFVDATTFRISSTVEVPEGDEERAYGFPQFHVTSWTNGALRSGMFDFQNGMFFEFDGQKLYAVRRSSTQQTAGTVSALRGSELVFGDNTQFTAQFDEGDSIVMRGQTYKVIEIKNDVEMSIRPEYRGSTGLELSFDPETQVSIETNTFTIVRHGLSQNIPVIYNSIDGEPIGGLINGNTYYADVVDANRFMLMASPNSETTVTVSSVGTTNVHTFTPAKSGIILTKTVDTRVPQDEWNIDKCDGTGDSGYNLDLSRIQMCYIDYSWYGAGKIRFGFKGDDGQVFYTHEFKHNNVLFESYLRSGNLPARYEVVTFENPTYIPSLFHWGTSVIMDGRFDDDRGYLFTKRSQTLEIRGTTTKSFAGTGIDLNTDLITSLTHAFRTGDTVQFQSIAADGLPGIDILNPATRVVGSNTSAFAKNNDKYKVLVNSPDRIHLVPLTSKISLGGATSQSGTTVRVVTAAPHELTTGMYTGIYGSNSIPNGARAVTVENSTSFTFTAPAGARTLVNISTAILQNNVATLTTAIPHGFVVGDRITVSGATNATYNGTYTISATPTQTRFSYARTNANINSAASVGTVAIQINSLPQVNLTTTVLTSNIVTITTQVAHGFSLGQTVVIAGASNAVYNGTYQIIDVPAINQFRYEKVNANINSAGSSGTAAVTIDSNFETGLAVSEVIDFETAGNIQYTYFLHPDGSLNNTTGPNYQPLMSLRLSPSVDAGLTGKLGDKDIINRMQVRMQEIGVSTDELVEVKLILNGRLNNLGFVASDAPSLVEIVEHTLQDTISGGIQVYNFEAEGGQDGNSSTTTVDIGTLFELSNSILGGDNIFPDGPDILTVCVSRLTGNDTRASAKLSWGEAQA
jgi:hypothetical protein